MAPLGSLRLPASSLIQLLPIPAWRVKAVPCVLVQKIGTERAWLGALLWGKATDLVACAAEGGVSLRESGLRAKGWRGGEVREVREVSQGGVEGLGSRPIAFGLPKAVHNKSPRPCPSPWPEKGALSSVKHPNIQTSLRTQLPSRKSSSSPPPFPSRASRGSISGPSWGGLSPAEIGGGQLTSDIDGSFPRASIRRPRLGEHFIRHAATLSLKWIPKSRLTSGALNGFCISLSLGTPTAVPFLLPRRQ